MSSGRQPPAADERKPPDGLANDRLGRSRDGERVMLTGSCPRCGGDRIVPVVFGFPTRETEAAAARGEFILGGDSLSPEVLHDNVGCADCCYRWHEPDTAR